MNEYPNKQFKGPAKVGTFFEQKDEGTRRNHQRSNKMKPTRKQRLEVQLRACVRILLEAYRISSHTEQDKAIDDVIGMLRRMKKRPSTHNLLSRSEHLDSLKARKFSFRAWFNNVVRRVK